MNERDLVRLLKWHFDHGDKIVEISRDLLAEIPSLQRDVVSTANVFAILNGHDPITEKVVDTGKLHKFCEKYGFLSCLQENMRDFVFYLR